MRIRFCNRLYCQILYHRWMIKIPFRKFIQYINNIYYELFSLSVSFSFSRKERDKTQIT